MLSNAAALPAPLAGEPSGRRPSYIDFVLVPALYYLSARVGVALTVMPEGTAILWPANGILLAALLRFQGRGWWRFALLILVAEIAADVPVFRIHEAVLFGVNNIAEATLAYALLKRWRFDPGFKRPSDLVKFVAAGPLIAALLGASVLALIYSVFRGAQTGYLEFLRVSWFGDATGLAIVTPLLLAGWMPAEGRLDSPPRFGWIPDGIAMAGGLLALALLIASNNGTLLGIHVGPVLLLPFVIYFTARLRLFHAVVIVAGATLVILVLTTLGRNPFGHTNARDAVIHAQEFIGIMTVIVLGLGTLLTNLRASQHALGVANESLERRVAERTRELEHALLHVKRLQGLLPICAWCKKVRDGDDYWHSVEDYITARTDARFSHGICPDCWTAVSSQIDGTFPPAESQPTAPEDQSGDPTI